MRLIVISTALESDPPETVYPAVVASALIQLSIRQVGRVAVGITQDPFIGGAARLSGRVNVFIREGVLIQAQFKLTGSIAITITDDTAVSWRDMTEAQWLDIGETQWRQIS